MRDIEFCIDYLKKYNGISEDINLDERNTLRALMNITMPYDLSDDYYLKQDNVLKEILSQKEIIYIEDLEEMSRNIYIYKGDITLLKTDGIVNACNAKLLGCFQPLHSCIDNAIHSFAGLQVRRDLLKVMEKQGHDEENGKAKVTKGYNLPADYIFHTVGPIYSGIRRDEIDLYNCYISCLRKAKEMKLKSICFCSISTGVYGYPIEKASTVAISAVRDYLKDNNDIKVIFNLFSEGDYNVYYRKLKELN